MNAAFAKRVTGGEELTEDEKKQIQYQQKVCDIISFIIIVTWTYTAKIMVFCLPRILVHVSSKTFDH